MFKLEPENILYCDNHVLAVRKLGGQLVQGDQTGDYTLLEAAKQFIKDKYNKPGNVFLGLVHRLDRPVGGIIVFARTSKAAARLSQQIREKTFQKNYLACVAGKTQITGKLVDHIERVGSTSKISTKNTQYCELFYKRLAVNESTSLVEINLITGRHHQIRVQFSSRGHAIIGDKRYQSEVAFEKGKIALFANHVEFMHPTKDEKIVLTAAVEEFWHRYINFDMNVWRKI